MTEGIGDKFHRKTKYSRESLEGRMLDWANEPEVYKQYPGSKQVELPPFESLETGNVMNALRGRRSIRRYSGEPLSMEEVSYLLWAAGGVQRTERGYDFRTAPSAGALYPVETYLMVDAVRDLAPGLYHYAVKSHRLEELRLGQLGHEITAAALDQKMCLEAAVVFIWTAIFRRSTWKYEDRAYRYIYMDAGHIAENLALAATSIGLGSCQIGALFDDEVNELIGVDGSDESVIYMSVVGHPA